MHSTKINHFQFTKLTQTTKFPHNAPIHKIFSFRPTHSPRDPQILPHFQSNQTAPYLITTLVPIIYFSVSRIEKRPLAASGQNGLIFIRFSVP